MSRMSEMSAFQLSRWCALFEAVNFIADECDERGIDFENVGLEPLYIRKFIESKCDNLTLQIEAYREAEEVARIARAEYQHELQLTIPDSMKESVLA